VAFGHGLLSESVPPSFFRRAQLLHHSISGLGPEATPANNPTLQVALGLDNATFRLALDASLGRPGANNKDAVEPNRGRNRTMGHVSPGSCLWRTMDGTTRTSLLLASSRTLTRLLPRLGLGQEFPVSIGSPAKPASGPTDRASAPGISHYLPEGTRGGSLLQCGF
jgi:hypothetical protein